MKKDVDDYLQEGIYGAKEINPSERKIFLGTIRERVVFVLTKGEVMKAKGINELEEKMIENPEARILLNGNITFRFFKPYRQIASKHNTLYTTVNNRDAKSDYGLVLTFDHAVDYSDEDIVLQETPVVEAPKKEKTSFWSKLFGSND
ncbi:YueI family protein [Paraliobacillus salinarum]|uniref:YueI family protein n=1 Tax=Paraliobacillus salinarum TaxID=1158996 RepID=UPI001FE4CA22|nr:YueI family protein [Paraliobacillus salinarum]